MKKVERIIYASLGMILLSAGIAFIAKARIGSDCLTLFVQALNANFGFTVGTWNTIVGVVCVIVALICDKKKIGYATIFYLIVNKFIIDGLLELLPMPTSFIVDSVYCVIAIVLISFGSALTIAARIGMSYYDAFCYAVSEKFKFKYVYFRYVLEGIFLVTSLLLHEYPGIGTIIYFVTLGPCLTFALNLIKEPIRKRLDLPL